MTDERVDLPERERRRRNPRREKAGHAKGGLEVEGHLGGFVHGGRAEALRETEDAEDPPDADHTFAGLNGRTHCVQMRAGMAGAGEQGECRRWRAGRAVAVVDVSMTNTLVPDVVEDATDGGIICTNSP